MGGSAADGFVLWGPLLVLAGAAIGPALLSAIGVPTTVAVVICVDVAGGTVRWRRRTCADCTTQPTARAAELWKTGPGR